MDLWIRSQDREILRVNPELELFKYGKETFLVIDTKGCTSYDKAKVLGKYKNKTRALEVLDEIHSILMPQVKAIYNNKIEEVKLQDITSNIIVQPIIKDIQIQQANSYVYKMPEE